MFITSHYEDTRAILHKYFILPFYNNGKMLTNITVNAQSNVYNFFAYIKFVTICAFYSINSII